MKKSIALLVLGLALAACGSSGSTTPKAGGTTPSPGASSPTNTAASCSPAGTSLQITAKNLAFDKSCLAAPAGQKFTIDLINNDSGTTHNLAILTADPTKDPSARKLFGGTMFAGVKSMTYNVAALQAGTYFFHCEVHPTQM